MKSNYHNYSITYCIHLILRYLYFNIKQTTCASVTLFIINNQFEIKTKTEIETILTHAAPLTFSIDLYQYNLLRNSGILSAFPPQDQVSVLVPWWYYVSPKKSLLRLYFLLAQAPSRCLTSTCLV